MCQLGDDTLDEPRVLVQVEQSLKKFSHLSTRGSSVGIVFGTKFDRVFQQVVLLLRLVDH